MSIIAIIVAIFYAIGAISVATAAFLINMPVGFLVVGVLCFIPTVVLYVEASKGGVN